MSSILKRKITMLHRQGTHGNNRFSGNYNRYDSLRGSGSIHDEKEQDYKQFFDDQMKSFIESSSSSFQFVCKGDGDSSNNPAAVLSLEDFWIEEHEFFNGVNSVEE